MSGESAAHSAADRTAGTIPAVRSGLRQNLPQFVLLVAVNALVGGMLGQERTVVPLLGRRVFGLSGYTAGLTFVLVFDSVQGRHQPLRRDETHHRRRAEMINS